jgi:hypothetical protein
VPRRLEGAGRPPRRVPADHPICTAYGRRAAFIRSAATVVASFSGLGGERPVQSGTGAPLLFDLALHLDARRISKPSSAFDKEEPQLSSAGAERPRPRVGELDLPLSARPARRMAAHDRRDTRRPDNATTRQKSSPKSSSLSKPPRSSDFPAWIRMICPLGAARHVLRAVLDVLAGVDDRPGPRLPDRQREHRLRHAGDRLPRRASSVAMSCACNVKVVVSMACYSIAANVSRAIRASA